MSLVDLHHFFAMGGYAGYVWPAYAVFFAVLLADTVAPAVRRRQVLRDLRAQLARQAARRAHKDGDTISASITRPSAPPPRST